ncbi:MAG: AAA family ATPase [Legionellales bacterium]|nr:AAA family ATPase [Legionellales bacterium]
MKITGRDREQKKLDEFYHSNRSEFMAVYGRRRVGKTYLIKNYFKTKDCVFFSTTGIDQGSFKTQRTVFCTELSRQLFHNIPIAIPTSWLKIFEILDQAINESKKKFIIFLDELPWMTTPKSQLLETIEYFWNQHWSHTKKVKLIICGSLSSWIIRHVIENTGGFYHRVTFRLKIEPFNLSQTRSFLEIGSGINLTNAQILKLYSVMGGIPLYLEQIKKGRSADQLIDDICFNKEGLLFDEMEELVKSLFKNSSQYMDIIREIAKHRYGIDKRNLAKKVNIAYGGRLTTRLKELEDAGFIISFLPYQHKEKGIYYRIIDEYTMFYFSWIEPNIRSIKRLSSSSGYWLVKSKESSFQAWKGYTFESICYKHISEIVNTLNIPKTSSVYSWRYAPQAKSKEFGAQIDLLFDRNDDAITLCEIKYTDKPYSIDKQYAGLLKNKIKIFQEKTRTTKQLFFIMVSANGIKKNKYSDELIDGLVTLDDLFTDND